MTKERLRLYAEIKKEAEQLRGKIREIDARLYAPKTQRITGMPHGGGGSDAREHQIDMVSELRRLYRAKLRELAAEQLAVERAIETLDPTARMLLRYRYMDGRKWEEVCVLMNYSWVQTHRLHAAALDKLKEKAGE